MESADSHLEQKVRVRTKARAGKAGQHTELRLPRATAKDINVKAAMQAIFRRQKSVAGCLDRKPEHPRIKHRLVLDDDDVGMTGRSRRYGGRQRQRFVCDVAQHKTSSLSP